SRRQPGRHRYLRSVPTGRPDHSHVFDDQHYPGVAASALDRVEHDPNDHFQADALRCPDWGLGWRLAPAAEKIEVGTAPDAALPDRSPGGRGGDGHSPIVWIAP